MQQLSSLNRPFHLVQPGWLFAPSCITLASALLTTVALPVIAQTQQEQSVFGQTGQTIPFTLSSSAVPQSAQGWYQQGLTHFNRGEFAKAEQAFRSTIQQQPRFALAHNWLGNSLAQQNKLQAASTIPRGNASRPKAV